MFRTRDEIFTARSLDPARPMTDQRRYTDDEIGEIFDRAAEVRGSERTLPSSHEGLTLTELQEIGREVGLEPERIAEAASALDSGGQVLPRRTRFGLPFSVGRTVDLPRAPTDEEWAVLVGELRRTFSAHGRVGGSGGLREWTNGNLHAYVEPTGDGYRLRLGTMKEQAVQLSQLGIGLLLFAVVMATLLYFRGDPEKAIRVMTILGAMGGGALGTGLLGLPRWARTREEQMERIAERARELIAGDGGEPDEGEGETVGGGSATGGDTGTTANGGERAS